MSERLLPIRQTLVFPPPCSPHCPSPLGEILGSEIEQLCCEMENVSTGCPGGFNLVSKGNDCSEDHRLVVRGQEGLLGCQLTCAVSLRLRPGPTPACCAPLGFAAQRWGYWANRNSLVEEHWAPPFGVLGKGSPPGGSAKVNLVTACELPKLGADSRTDGTF